MSEETQRDIRQLLKQFGVQADEMVMAHIARQPGQTPLTIRLTLTDVTDYGDNPPAEPLRLEIEKEIRRQAAAE